MIFKNEDEKQKRRLSLEETDSFWSVDDITPRKKINNSPFKKTDTETVLVTEEKDVSSKVCGEKISANFLESEVLDSYTPDTPFITKVTISSWPSKYTFYERFRLDAKRYFDTKHGEVIPVKFFSYMPGYVQMSVKQKEWYFYWRDCVRNKVYLPTDSSYILLYLYEIINLPELIPPQKGIELICDIWENYREAYTKLDRFLTEWVCDYCLINKLRMPMERIEGFYHEALSASGFKQFYINCEKDDIYSALLMERTSSYRWEKSKYITEDNRKLFEKHIKGAFAYFVKKMAVSDGRFDKNSGRLVVSSAVRDAFSGSLCSYNTKRKINVEYYEVANVDDLSFAVTDAVRYCENRVRAYLGIRARLSVQNLTEQQKDILNAYFDKELPAHFVEKKKKKEYVYEAEETEVRPFKVSFENAREIEKRSWQITDRLVVYDEYDEAQEKSVEETTEIGKKENISLEAEALNVAKTALICIAKGDKNGFMKIAEECFMLPETLAECVNELCYEVLGDIGIEETEDGYRVISDYEGEIRQWLNS